MALKRKPHKGKTAARWRGPEGEYLADLCDSIRYSDILTTRRKRKATWEEVWRELRKMGYGVHTEPNKLKADYHTGSMYREKRRWDEAACGSEGLALIDLVYDIVDGTSCDDGNGILDWDLIKRRLHPDDPRITAKILEARYERAAAYWTGRYSNDAMCIARDFLNRRRNLRS